MTNSVLLTQRPEVYAYLYEQLGSAFDELAVKPELRPTARYFFYAGWFFPGYPYIVRKTPFDGVLGTTCLLTEVLTYGRVR